MLVSFVLMIVISTSLTVRGQPSPRFRVEAWLPFRNRELDYCGYTNATSGTCTSFKKTQNYYAFFAFMNSKYEFGYIHNSRK